MLTGTYRIALNLAIEGMKAPVRCFAYCTNKLFILPMSVLQSKCARQDFGYFHKGASGRSVLGKLSQVGVQLKKATRRLSEEQTTDLEKVLDIDEIMWLRKFRQVTDDVQMQIEDM